MTAVGLWAGAKSHWGPFAHLTADVLLGVILRIAAVLASGWSLIRTTS